MDDVQIIELYFARSERAIEETDIKYGRFLHTVINNILRSLEDTEEVVSDTYMGAWNSMPPTRPNVLKHFLSRIARNLSLDRLDYMKAKKRSLYAETLLSELDDCVPASTGGPEGAWEDKEIARVINEFLEKQEQLNAAVFVKRYYYGSSLRDIALDYNISERKVKYILHRMRLKLREALRKEGVVL